MAASSQQTTGGAVDAESLVVTFEAWLAGRPLAERSRHAYRAQVAGFVAWLARSGFDAEALSDPELRDSAVGDYKQYLRVTGGWKPASINQGLTAIDHFYRSVGMGTPDVAREDRPQVAPRVLIEEEQRRFLLAVAACPSVRDRAIATVFFFTGMRLSELAGLRVDDILVTALRGRVRVRSGRGDGSRDVALNGACRMVLDDWIEARVDKVAALAKTHPTVIDEDALWLSRVGGPMTVRAIDVVIRRLAGEADLDASAYTLRHTYVTNLIRAGADVALVAEIAGHRRLHTTRRYGRQSLTDA